MYLPIFLRCSFKVHQKIFLRESCALVCDSNLVICGILIHHYMVKLGNETNKVLLCLINFSRNLFPMIMTSNNPYNNSELQLQYTYSFCYILTRYIDSRMSFDYMLSSIALIIDKSNNSSPLHHF